MVYGLLLGQALSIINIIPDSAVDSDIFGTHLEKASSYTSFLRCVLSME
jgi:hypothetical protein